MYCDFFLYRINDSKYPTDFYINQNKRMWWHNANVNYLKSCVRRSVIVGLQDNGSVLSARHKLMRTRFYLYNKNTEIFCVYTNRHIAERFYGETVWYAFIRNVQYEILHRHHHRRRRRCVDWFKIARRNATVNIAYEMSFFSYWYILRAKKFGGRINKTTTYENFTEKLLRTWEWNWN